MTNNGAIKGLDVREDGIYITYTNGADTVTKKLGDPTIKTQTVQSGRLDNIGYNYVMKFDNLSKVSGISSLSIRGYSTPERQHDTSCSVSISGNTVHFVSPSGDSYYEYTCTAFEIIN